MPDSPAAFATIDPRIAAAIVAALSAMLADGSYDRLIYSYDVGSIVTWSRYPGHVQSYFDP